MTKNDGHGRRPLGIVPPPQPNPKDLNMAGRVIVTAYTDGRPIDVDATCNPLDGILLLCQGIINAIKYLKNMQLAASGGQADPVDKERKYLGPRESISYGTGEGEDGKKE